ncbi:MAG: 3-hydroxyacyl-CoA dehydrogenase family protein [Xanthobacter sp.]
MDLAVIGSGLMGGGIAMDAARHGLPVRLYDANPDNIERLKARAAKVYARWVKNGRMSEAEAEAALARMVPTTSMADLGAADIIIEAVFEDLGVKREVLTALAPHLGPNSIVATNTSALRVRDLAKGFAFADRILGLHYFSPAEVSPLVEVVRAEKTSDQTLERANVFLKATRRTPLPCADAPGFAINRFFCPYYNEATRIVEDGLATPAEVDVVARERLGVAAGPFVVLNLIGPRVSSHAMANLSSLGPFYQVSRLLVSREEETTPYELPDDAALPARADEVEDRLVAAIAIPALELQAEHVADPVETDRGAQLALRFGEGPFTLMRRFPAARLEAAVKAMCTRYGHPMPTITLPPAP